MATDEPKSKMGGQIIVAVITALSVVGAAWIKGCNKPEGVDQKPIPYAGVVLTNGHRPVAEATIIATSDQSVGQPIRADVNGQFQIMVPAKTETLRLMVSADGYETQTVQAQIRRTGPEEIFLMPVRPSPSANPGKSPLRNSKTQSSAIPAHSGPAVPAPTQLAFQSPTRTGSEPPPQPVAVPKNYGVKSAYEKLGDALKDLKQVDSDWHYGVDGVLRQRHRFLQQTVEKSAEANLNRQADDNFLLNMGRLEARVSAKWEPLSVQLDSAVNDAVKRMEQPGPNQLTPRAASSERARYEQAKSAAVLPLDDELRRGVTNQSRFAGLIDYLEGLHIRLSDYTETVEPSRAPYALSWSPTIALQGL